MYYGSGCNTYGFPYMDGGSVIPAVGCGYGINWFIIIVVLFILLIIIGAACIKF